MRACRFAVLVLLLGLAFREEGRLAIMSALRFKFMQGFVLQSESVLVPIALLLYEATLWAIDGFSNRSTGSWMRWMHIPSGAILWPIVVGLLGRLHAPR